MQVVREKKRRKVKSFKCMSFSLLTHLSRCKRFVMNYAELQSRVVLLVVVVVVEETEEEG